MPTSTFREEPARPQDIFQTRPQYRSNITYAKDRSYERTLLPDLPGTKKETKSLISPAIQVVSSHRPLRSKLRVPGRLTSTTSSDIGTRERLSDISSTTASSPSKYEVSSSPSRSSSSTNEAVDLIDRQDTSPGKRRRIGDTSWDQKLALALQDESEEMPAVSEVVADTIKRAHTRLSQCPVCKKDLPKEPSLQLHRKIQTFRSIRDDGSDDWKQRLIRTQYAICSLHMAEQQVLPDGKRHGYPVTIDFDQLPKRLRRHRKHLDGVIRGNTKSPYKIAWEKRLKDFGPLAKSTHMLMQFYPDTLPGYYGPRGAAILFDILREMFLKPSKTRRKVDNTNLVEFIQMILIPEASTLLIREDYGECDMTRAQEIRRDSVKFGQLVHHGDDNNEDSDGNDET